MRILLATDGSPDARRAEALVASIRWPVRTHVSLLQVDGPMPGDGERSRADLIALHDEIRAEILLHLEELRREIKKKHPRVTTECISLPGHPGDVIVEYARASRADLVVMGSRGHGAVASAFLGSVAAHVLDHAPCPVLVARTQVIRGAVVADDGSDGARHAEELIARWPILRGHPVRVVSVADASPLNTGFGSGIDVGSYAAYDELLHGLRQAHEGYARAGAQRLAPLGSHVSHVVRTGNVPAEILATAVETSADLIVVGSRGRTGLSRLLLGSVARGVLFGAPVSVLIVRERREIAARASPPAPREPVEARA